MIDPTWYSLLDLLSGVHKSEDIIYFMWMCDTCLVNSRQALVLGLLHPIKFEFTKVLLSIKVVLVFLRWNYLTDVHGDEILPQFVAMWASIRHLRNNVHLINEALWVRLYVLDVSCV